MIKNIDKNEKRTEKQLKEDYEIEKKLANRLRNASKQERYNLYSSLYNDFYMLLPKTSQLIRKASPERQKEALKNQIKLVYMAISESSYSDFGVVRTV